LEHGLAGFEPWHRAIGSRRGGADLTKYKEIAKQLLTDLSALDTAATPAPKAGSEEAPALESELSATGRASLASLRADAGAYYAMAQSWAAGAGLTPEQRRPFLAPFAQLAQIGDHDIASVVRRVWKEEMRPLVRDVANRFPFNRSSDKVVEPDELVELFHPVDGKFFQLFRSYLEPISAFGDGQPFRPLPSARAAFQFPSDLYPTVNAVAALSARLWDEKGEPRALEVRVATVPFNTESKAILVPTVVHLQVGKASIFNFNQRPDSSPLPLSWMEDDDAQLALHVTNVETGETTFPAALAAPGKHWRFFRLLRAAKSHHTESDGSATYEWERPLKEGSQQRTRVRLRFDEDPWATLGLGSGESSAGSGP
jgi:type VI protein secretion system component VasK